MVRRKHRSVRMVRILRISLFAASSLYMLYLLSSHHRMRASMIPVRETTDSTFFVLAPDDLPQEMQFEEYQRLERFRNDLPDSLHSADLSTMVQIMHWLGLRNKSARIRGYVPESPRQSRRFLLEEDVRGSCYNDAILFSTYAQSVGARARVFAFDGDDGMGGSGHNVTEIWSEEHNKWIMFDAQQCAIFIDAATRIPASAIEVRYAALAGTKYFSERMRIYQAEGFVVSEEYIAEFYIRSRDFNILATSNFHTQVEQQASRQISEWLELQGQTFGKPALWIGRLVRSAFGPPFIRFRYVDENTPAFAFDPWYVAYRIAIPVWLISVLLILLSALRRRSKFGGIQYWMRTGRPTHHLLDRTIPEKLEPFLPHPSQVPAGRTPPRAGQ